MDNKTCWICGKNDLDGWDELAKHIMTSSDKKHRSNKKARKWAAERQHSQRKRLIMQSKQFGRTPLTDEQREAKEDTRRELSGQTKLVPVKCPNLRCKTGIRYQDLELEHVANPQA